MLNIRFHEYLSNERRALPLGHRRGEIDRQTGGRTKTARERERERAVTKLEVASCNFPNASKHGISLKETSSLNSKT